MTARIDTTQEQLHPRTRETLDLLRRASPRNGPDAETIARVHELHAEHERARGRGDAAVAAEERALACPRESQP
jgi:hypothetical protein